MRLFLVIFVCLTGVFASYPVLAAEAVAPTSVRSSKLPLYEYGIGGLASYLPHYRGSDEYTIWAFPIPYFIYRGEKLRADREGVRGIFLRNAHWQTDLSFGGNPPVSDENEAREGMGDLDGLVEIGPALRYYFFEEGSRDSFFTQLSFRGAFSAGWDNGPRSDYEGNTTELSLSYLDSKRLAEQAIWYHFDISLRFGDSEIHSYFYDVEQDQATAWRPQYSAGGGYDGFHVSTSFFKDFTETVTAGFYLRWTNVDGAVFEGSPLVREKNNLSSVFMVFWKLGKSGKMVR